MPSSVIGHIVYQEERSELVVTFTSGKVYAYGLVPRRIYEDFRRSGSKGNFFNSHIRDRYPARRLKSIEGSTMDWNAALKKLQDL